MRLLLLTFITSTVLQAQNLVPNPSFEDTTQFSNGQPKVIAWQTNIGSPDYFSPHILPPFDGYKTPVNIRGNQAAYSGVAYFGFGVFNGNRLNEREYLQIKLNDSLRKGQYYEVEFYLSLADSFHNAMNSDNIGIAFRSQLDNGIIDHRVREFRPYYISDSIWDSKDKISWQKFHYTHTALGGEEVLVIGCFLKDVDITLTSVGNGGNFPLALTGSYYYIDQISVQWKDTSTNIVEHSFLNGAKFHPNPVKEQLLFSTHNFQVLQFEMFTLQGQNIPVSISQEGNQYRFNMGHLTKGLYIINAKGEKGQRSFKVIKE